MKLVITTRGSCKTTWPSAMPSESATPVSRRLRRTAGSAPGRASDASSPRGDHLGEHHPVVCSAVDLFLRIVAMCAVLHDEDAERIAGAQHRHPRNEW